MDRVRGLDFEAQMGAGKEYQRTFLMKLTPKCQFKGPSWFACR